MSIGKFMTPALEEMLTTIPPLFSNILGNSNLVIYAIIIMIIIVYSWYPTSNFSIKHHYYKNVWWLFFLTAYPDILCMQ